LLYKKNTKNHGQLDVTHLDLNALVILILKVLLTMSSLKKYL